jgi:ATP-binding cassette subfamily B protein
MRFPLRYQLEATDCGPSCIQMIAAYYGKSIPLSVLKNYCHVTRLGISTKDVIDGCKHIGLKGVVLHLSIARIRQMPLPAILYWRQEHFVVLYDVREKKGKYTYCIADPGFGRIKLDEQDFLKDWSTNNEMGIVILLEPTNLFYKLEYETDRKKLIDIFSPFKYLLNHKKNICYSLLFIGVTFFCSWMLPFILQNIIDKGIGNKDIHFVFLMLCAQLFLVSGNLISSFISNKIIFKIGLNINIEIAVDYLYKLVRLPINFFDTRLGTDLLQRVNDEEKIKDFLTYTINSVVLIAINFLVYSSVLLYYNMYIFFLFALFSSLSGFSARFILRNRILINYSLFSSFSKKKNLEYELVNGMIEIKTNASDQLFLNKWEKSQKEINRLSLKNLYLDYYLNTGTAFLNVLRDILITGGCAYLVMRSQMTIGVMMTISYILGQLSGSVNQVVNFFKSFQDSRLAYDRIGEIMKVPDENKGRDILLAEMRTFHKGFVFDNVSFKYDGSFNPFVLNNLMMQIPLGKVTAIVGASGSGKTTLLKQLLAFYYPQKGDIYLDDIKMSQINTINWHKKCGVVMQDGYIFSDTIGRNIAIAEENPDTERLTTAAGIACIDDFIHRLPLKYNTKIGKSGVDLSGGQKQRILIARAVYKNPDFLFFDEATSTLDANNEKQIMDNLKVFYQGKTVVIIAHRLSTVRDADNILVLDEGYLVEEGTHQDLVQKKGIYYHLIKNQLELGI